MYTPSFPWDLDKVMINDRTSGDCTLLAESFGVFILLLCCGNIDSKSIEKCLENEIFYNSQLAC